MACHAVGHHPALCRINAAKDALSLALIALIGGNRPAMSPAEVRYHLVSRYHIDAEAFTVSRYAPEDFLVRFHARDVLEDVLHAPTPLGAPFTLLWRRWCHQPTATADALYFKVLIGISEFSAHLWSSEVVQHIGGSSCTGLEEVLATAAREDLREYLVAGWCIHPNMVLREETIYVPESLAPFVGGPPLFLREHELIHSQLSVLRYSVTIRIVEVHDWAAPPSPARQEPMLLAVEETGNRGVPRKQDDDQESLS